MLCPHRIPFGLGEGSPVPTGDDRADQGPVRIRQETVVQQLADPVTPGRDGHIGLDGQDRTVMVAIQFEWRNDGARRFSSSTNRGVWSLRFRRAVVA